MHAADCLRQDNGSNCSNLSAYLHDMQGMYCRHGSVCRGRLVVHYWFLIDGANVESTVSSLLQYQVKNNNSVLFWKNKQSYSASIYLKYGKNMWTPSSEFVFSSIPSWQILTAQAKPSRGARDLAFCLKVPLDSLLVRASSEGSGETARMRRLAWTFTAPIGYKYQIRLTRSM